MSDPTKFRVEVLCDNYAGSMQQGWRPAIAGTINMTGLSDEKASTFDTYKDADDIRNMVIEQSNLPPTRVRIAKV